MLENAKSEARNSKQIQMIKRQKIRNAWFEKVSPVWTLGFVSDFDIRISNLGAATSQSNRNHPDKQRARRRLGHRHTGKSKAREGVGQRHAVCGDLPVGCE